MIGKIKKGSGFKGCVNYVLGKEQAALLHAEGVLTESSRDIIRSFILQAGMNPDLKKPVGHIALSYSPVDVCFHRYRIESPLRQGCIGEEGNQQESYDDGIKRLCSSFDMRYR